MSVYDEVSREKAVEILIKAGATEEWANDYLDSCPALTEDKILGICANSKGVIGLGKSQGYKTEYDRGALSVLVIQ